MTPTDSSGQSSTDRASGGADSSFGSTLFDRVSFWFWIVLVGYSLVLVFGVDFRFVVNGLLDDSFYYMEVARNVAAGLGSTFDGTEPTNGYHPLWMWLLVPIHWLFQSGEACTRGGLALGVGIGALALWNLRAVLREQVSSWAAALGLAVFVWPRFFGQTLNLLETALLLFCYLALFRMWVSPRRFSHLTTSAFAVLLGVASLARLDTVFLLLTISGSAAICFVLRRPFWPGRTAPTRIVDLLPFGLTALCLLPYLLWNWSTFGHLQPISGAMKSAFPNVLFRVENLTQFPEFAALQGLAVAFALTGFRSRASRLARILGLFSVASILHTSYTVLFMRWAVDRWHFGLLLVVGLVGLPYLAEQSFRWIRQRSHISTSLLLRLQALTLLLLLVVVIWAQSYSLRLRTHRYQADTWELAGWIRQNTPEDAVFATTDSGILAYFSDRPTINLDGLINNYRYWTYLKENRVVEYLRERNVAYILDQYVVGRPDLVSGDYESRVYRLWFRPEDRVSSVITLYREDEVRRIPCNVRFSLGSTATLPNAIVLWKYRPDGQLPVRP